MTPVQSEIKHRRMKDGLNLVDLPRRSGSREGEDPRTYDCANTERRQTPWAKRLSKPPFRF